MNKIIRGLLADSQHFLHFLDSYYIWVVVKQFLIIPYLYFQYKYLRFYIAPVVLWFLCPGILLLRVRLNKIYSFVASPMTRGLLL